MGKQVEQPLLEDGKTLLEVPPLSPSIFFADGHVRKGEDNGCRWHGFLRSGVFIDA